MLKLVDSHVHLDLLDDPDGAIREALAAGVSNLLAVGINIASSSAAIEYAQACDQVAAAVGVHPHDATLLDSANFEQLRKLAREKEVVAIGETGLDYHRDRSPREAQKKAFISQMELARSTGKTLIVHSRDAAGDTLELLREHARGLVVVLHCFSLADHLEECIDSGYYMSIAGNVTFKNASDLRQAATAIPEHLLLTETDAPFLSPVPRRGETNHPCNVGLVLEQLAELRGVRSSSLAERVATNYRRAFGLLYNC